MKEMEESTTDNIMRAWTDCSHSEREETHTNSYLFKTIISQPQCRHNVQSKKQQKHNYKCFSDATSQLCCQLVSLVHCDTLCSCKVSVSMCFINSLCKYCIYIYICHSNCSYPPFSLTDAHNQVSVALSYMHLYQRSVFSMSPQDHQDQKKNNRIHKN